TSLVRTWPSTIIRRAAAKSNIGGSENEVNGASVAASSGQRQGAVAGPERLLYSRDRSMDPEKACPGLDPGWIPVFGERSCSSKKRERCCALRARCCAGATWRSGYATVCKTVYPGSIPGV